VAAWKVLRDDDRQEHTKKVLAGGEWRNASGDIRVSKCVPTLRSALFRERGRPVVGAEAQLAVAAAAAAYPAWSADASAERARCSSRQSRSCKRRAREIRRTSSQSRPGARFVFATFQQDLVPRRSEQAAAGCTYRREKPDSNVPGVARSASAASSAWSRSSAVERRERCCVGAVLSPVAACATTVVVEPSELAPISAGMNLPRSAEGPGPEGRHQRRDHEPARGGDRRWVLRAPRGRSST